MPVGRVVAYDELIQRSAGERVLFERDVDVGAEVVDLVGVHAARREACPYSVA